MPVSLRIDIPRARLLADRLFKAFSPGGPGIFGRSTMPEDEPPLGVELGSLEHVLFITLTVSIDYQRDAHELWAASRAAYANPGRYEGSVAEAFELVRAAWRDGTKGLKVGPRPMMALDVDESLWHLSKFGCSAGRDKEGSCSMKRACPAANECVMGLVEVGGTKIRIGT
jgi:hypothetical protein